MATANLDPLRVNPILLREAARSLLLIVIITIALWSPGKIVYHPENTNKVRSELLSSRINPNIDPWWKLATLPQIGEDRAKRIVKYRQAQKEVTVFKSAADLAKIRGLGPHTVARVAPFLCFETAEE